MVLSPANLQRSRAEHRGPLTRGDRQPTVHGQRCSCRDVHQHIAVHRHRRGDVMRAHVDIDHRLIGVAAEDQVAQATADVGTPDLYRNVPHADRRAIRRRLNVDNRRRIADKNIYYLGNPGQAQAVNSLRLERVCLGPRIGDRVNQIWEAAVTRSKQFLP